MEASVLEKYLFGKAERGDIILIEYSSLFPFEEFSWGILIPLLVRQRPTVIGDFFGIGDLMFRKYARKVGGTRYSDIIDLMRKIKVVKIGPGATSYGDVIEAITPSYDPQGFLKNYHTIMTKIIRYPVKPDFFVTFGLSHYINFGGKEAMKSLLTGISTIPMEDWISIHLINEDVLERDQMAILEEMASMVFHISNDGLKMRKAGGPVDQGGG